mmetsp:Transcript_46275/g.91258  ORF Transcript_46275/g.91258 Transcript_46275/m.91258 type:complete len:177 (-) Transcript_46275:590-1120(-)
MPKAIQSSPKMRDRKADRQTERQKRCTGCLPAKEDSIQTGGGTDGETERQTVLPPSLCHYGFATPFAEAVPPGALFASLCAPFFVPVSTCPFLLMTNAKHYRHFLPFLRFLPSFFLSFLSFFLAYILGDSLRSKDLSIGTSHTISSPHSDTSPFPAFHRSGCMDAWMILHTHRCEM